MLEGKATATKPNYELRPESKKANCLQSRSFAVLGRCFRQVSGQYEPPVLQLGLWTKNLSLASGFRMANIPVQNVLKVVAHERICLSCWIPGLKTYLTELLGWYCTLSHPFSTQSWGGLSSHHAAIWEFGNFGNDNFGMSKISITHEI